MEVKTKKLVYVGILDIFVSYQSVIAGKLVPMCDRTPGIIASFRVEIGYHGIIKPWSNIVTGVNCILELKTNWLNLNFTYIARH